MFGGKLAEVESSTEDNFLKQRIRQLHVTGLAKIYSLNICGLCNCSLKDLARCTYLSRFPWSSSLLKEGLIKLYFEFQLIRVFIYFQAIIGWGAVTSWLRGSGFGRAQDRPLSTLPGTRTNPIITVGRRTVS